MVIRPVSNAIDTTQSSEEVELPPDVLIKVMPWAKIRELTKIKDYNISDILDLFISNVYSTGLVDVATLYRFFVNLNRGVGFQDADGSSALHEKLKIFSRSFIEIFDDVNYEAGNMSARGKSVRFTDVACALSVLCGGEKTEKMGHAFNLYDHDEDGYLSKAQVRRSGVNEERRFSQQRHCAQNRYCFKQLLAFVFNITAANTAIASCSSLRLAPRRRFLVADQVAHEEHLRAAEVHGP